MAITIADIQVDLFKQFANAPTLQQHYVDYANNEIVDIASTYEIAEADIATPWHFKLDDHAINVAVYKFASERIGLHVSEDGRDVYAILAMLFDGNKQDSRSRITEVMFTGEAQTTSNRAVSGVELELG